MQRNFAHAVKKKKWKEHRIKTPVIGCPSVDSYVRVRRRFKFQIFSRYIYRVTPCAVLWQSAVVTSNKTNRVWSIDGLKYILKKKNPRDTHRFFSSIISWELGLRREFYLMKNTAYHYLRVAIAYRKLSKTRSFFFPLSEVAVAI